MNTFFSPVSLSLSQPWEFAIQGKKNANAQASAWGWGRWAQVELTDAVSTA